MQITPRLRYALLLVAAALLVAALAGPVKRTLAERERAEKSRAIAEQVARDRAAAAERFKADRPAIIAALRGHVERGEYVEALRVAAPFGAVPDEELRELYREAAQQESLRQRAAHYAALVERDRTEANAREWATRIAGTAAGDAARTHAPHRLVRVDGAEARRIVLSRMREPPPAEHAAHRPPPGSDAAAAAPPPPTERDPIARVRDDFRARLLPDYLGLVHSPKADSVICVWRAEGERTAGTRPIAWALDLWLAPAPDLKGLTGDAAGYAERPAAAG